MINFFFLTKSFMSHPADYLPAFDSALEEAVNSINPAYGKEFKSQFHIGLEGSFGQNAVTPRALSAKFINQLVCLDGIVTKGE